MKINGLIPRTSISSQLIRGSKNNFFKKGGIIARFDNGGQLGSGDPEPKPKPMSDAKHGNYGRYGGHENTKVAANLDFSQDQFLQIVSPEMKEYFMKNPERANAIYDMVRARIMKATTNEAESIIAQNPRANKNQVYMDVYQKKLKELPGMFSKKGYEEAGKKHSSTYVDPMTTTRGPVSGHYNRTELGY